MLDEIRELEMTAATDLPSDDPNFSVGNLVGDRNLTAAYRLGCTDGKVRLARKVIAYLTSGITCPPLGTQG